MVRIICLVDGYGDLVRSIGYLSYGIHNQAVVLFTVIGGYHIQTITDVEQSSHIVLIRSFAILGNVVTAQLCYYCVDLGSTLFTQSRFNSYSRFYHIQLFAAFQHLFHYVSSYGSPRTILDESYGAVLEITFSQMFDKVTHVREDTCIVGGGSQNDFAVTEGIGHSLSHVAASQVFDYNLGSAISAQLFSQHFNPLLGVAINGGIGNQNTLFLYRIGGPGIVQIQVITQIFFQNRAMQGTDHFNIQTGSLLQQFLHLSTVFTYNANVVTTCFVGPGLFHVQSTEFTKTVSRKQNFVMAIVSNDYFRPVNHGSSYKGQGMSTQFQSAALTHYNAAIGKIGSKELIHHGKGLSRSYDLYIGIYFHEVEDVRRMIRLHVLYDQIIGLTTFQYILHIIQPLMTKMNIYGIHDGDLFIHDHIRIVCHSIGHHILTFEQIYLMIINTYVTNISSNFHIILQVSMHLNSNHY